MSGRPRKQLPMSDEEIRREYRLAKDPKKQLKILADENDCSVSTIRSIVSADQPRGTLPSQEPAEKEAEFGSAPHQPPAATASLGESREDADAAEEAPSWPVLPSAPPLAGDFPEDGAAEVAERKEDGVVLSFVPIQDLADGLVSPPGTEPAAAGTEERIAPAPAGLRNDGAGEASAAAEREAEYSADWRGLMRTLADGGWAPTAQQPPVAAPAAAEEGGNIYRISGADLSRMWHILGRLQGVLEASAEAGRPGEVMKDACDELEVILCGIQQDAG